MKHLEILDAIYQDSLQNLTNCFNRARQAPAGSAGDVIKILYEFVKQVGDVARTINEVKTLEASKKAPPHA